MKFSHKSERRVTHEFADLPVAIERDTLGQAAALVFPDGERVASGCLGCKKALCSELTAEELKLQRLDELSSSSVQTLCPTGALTFIAGNSDPVINEKLCISCGLCAIRCPVGAITSDETATQIVSMSSELASYVTEIDHENVNAGKFNTSLLNIQKTIPSVPLFEDSHIVRVTQAVKLLPEADQNLFIRAILTTLGARMIVRRTGDVYTRMDGFFELADGAIGPVEIESGNDSLEAIRDTLEDLSVIHNRFDTSINAQTPLVVFFELPTERQGYWQVVADVENIFGIQVRTVTVGALLHLLWSQVPLTTSILKELNPKFGATSIRKAIETAIGRKSELPLREGGILEPSK